MGTKTHSPLDERAKVSFLSASRMKRELVLLEPKNLGRIIPDKVPGINRGTKADKATGAWRVGTWPHGGFCLICPLSCVLSPRPPPPAFEMLPAMWVTRLYVLCPFVLIFGREVTRL